MTCLPRLPCPVLQHLSQAHLVWELPHQQPAFCPAHRLKNLLPHQQPARCLVPPQVAVWAACLGPHPPPCQDPLPPRFQDPLSPLCQDPPPICPALHLRLCPAPHPMTFLHHQPTSLHHQPTSLHSLLSLSRCPDHQPSVACSKGSVGYQPQEDLEACLPHLPLEGVKPHLALVGSEVYHPHLLLEVSEGCHLHQPLQPGSLCPDPHQPMRQDPLPA